VNREPAAVNVVGFLTKLIKKLRVAHGHKKIEAVVRIADDYEQRRLLVAQGVKLVVHSERPNLGDVEGREPYAATYKYALSRFARNEMSRTFSSVSAK
jgi:hypothetical protein